MCRINGTELLRSRFAAVCQQAARPPLPTDSRWGTEQRRTAHRMSKAAVFAATLCTLVLSAAPAPAAEIKVIKRVGDVGHIEISGPIGPADDVTFSQIESKEHF